MLLTLAIPAMASAWNVPKERVTYDIMYKWGLINKKAGSVALETHPDSATSQFRARLTAATAPWADKFYHVRDTLKGFFRHTTKKSPMKVAITTATCSISHAQATPCVQMPHAGGYTKKTPP